MSAARKKTVGVSPKAPAASVAALVAPLLARALGDWLGVEFDSEVVEGLILAAIAGVSALAAAYWAPPGVVVADRTPRKAREAGYIDVITVGAVCGIVALVLLLIILF